MQWGRSIFLSWFKAQCVHSKFLIQKKVAQATTIWCATLQWLCRLYFAMQEGLHFIQPLAPTYSSNILCLLGEKTHSTTTTLQCADHNARHECFSFVTISTLANNGKRMSPKTRESHLLKAQVGLRVGVRWAEYLNAHLTSLSETL